MAFQHLEVPQAVTDRLLTEAREVGERMGRTALKAVRSDVAGVPIQMPVEKAKEIADQQAKEKAKEYLDNRIHGNGNDTASQAKGLVALVTEAGKAKIEAALIRGEGKSVDHGVAVESVELPKGRSPLFIVRLPEGGFSSSTEKETIKFLDAATITEVSLLGGVKVPMPADATASTAVLSNDDVITIGDEGGGYWHNPGYDIDGSPLVNV